jgi:hypothetical protein
VNLTSILIKNGSSVIEIICNSSVCRIHGTEVSNINLLKPNGYYMYHPLYLSVTMYFVFMNLVRFSVLTAIISLNGINQLIFVMVKCGVLFEVRTEFLNNI